MIAADAKDIPLRPGSVACAITSPPYPNERVYGDDPREIGRVKSLEAFVVQMIWVGRELRGRFLDFGQAAPGDDDLAPALFGKSPGCGMAEPRGCAGDEGDRMFHGRLRDEG